MSASQCLEPVNMLPLRGRRKFADMIQVEDPDGDIILGYLGGSNLST